MTRFYEFDSGGNRRFYRNLKRLCKMEGLAYDRVYYAVGRLKENWVGEKSETVRRQKFEDGDLPPGQPLAKIFEDGQH